MAAHVIGREPDPAEEGGDAVAELAAAGEAMDDQRLADQLAHRHARVERGVGVLEDHLDRAPDRFSAPWPRPAVERPSTRMSPCQATRSRSALPVVDLPQPEFADQRQRLADADLEGDALDRMHALDRPAQDAADDVEADGEVGDEDDGLRGPRRPPRGTPSPCGGTRSLAPCGGAMLRGVHRDSGSVSVAVERPRRPLPHPSPARGGRRPRTEPRHRGEQRPRVLLARLGENLPDRSGLDQLAVMHDDDAVGHLRDHAHVVGDEDERHAEVALQVAHQAEDLRLHGDVEGGGRLVGDQHLRIAGERDGDHDALAHAARELVRILAEALLGLGHAHRLQRRDRRSPAPRRGRDRDACGSPR